MRKKTLSLALALMMALSLVPSALAEEGGASKFTDVPADAWYFEELDYAVANGYISGTGDTTFSPSDNLTRAQFVTILGRMLNVDTTLYTSSKFNDVDPNIWYGPYVAWAADKGYVNGIGPNTFAPDDNLTFEQMGIIMANYIRESGAVPTPSSTFGGYADAEYIAPWARDSMDMMAKYDLLPVDEFGNVRPQDPVLRSEAAVALVRLAKGDGKGGKPISDGMDYIDPDLQAAWDEIDAYKAASDEAVKRIHDELWASGEITEDMTEKEKAIAYYKWMVINCRYGTGIAQGYPKYQSQDAYGALVNGIAVCEGLSGGYKNLLDYEGIACECVPYWSINHMTNKAILDGVEYEIDMAASCGQGNADGSFNQHIYEIFRDKYFYPDKWMENFKPLEW